MEDFNLHSKEFKQLLLFLGEGNFSFAKSVALSPEFSTSNCHLIASDFVPDHNLGLELDEFGNPLIINAEEEALIRGKEEKKVQRDSFNTSLLKKNVSQLKSKGYTVLLDVDATKIHEHEAIIKFCREEQITRICIVFNFPHVKSKKMKIGLNRDLLRDFFISCDQLWYQFNSKSGKEEKAEVESIIPIVSLCAGQSGIPEVESVERKWGDSWQVNEMAAQGNFVCTSIQKFGDWSLSKLCMSSADTSFPGESQQLYQSSYYRLQTGVSFTTNNALTFQYQHRKHIDPLQCDRLQYLQSMFKFTDSGCRDEIFEDFLQTFSPVTDERIISTIKAEESDKKCNDYQKRPYIHIVSCFCTETEYVAKIKDYLNIKSSSELELYLKEREVEDGDITTKKVFVRTTGKSSKEKVGVPVGESCPTDLTIMNLFVDRLLELKHGTDYRLLLSDNKTSTSLFPHFHEFHISFWVSPKFSFQSFLEVLLNVYGLILKSVEFVEEYDDKKGRKSILWKIQVQSLDYALSRIKAHEMYLQLRSQLSDKLEVEVR